MAVCNGVFCNDDRAAYLDQARVNLREVGGEVKICQGAGYCADWESSKLVPDCQWCVFLDAKDKRTSKQILEAIVASRTTGRH